MLARETGPAVPLADPDLVRRAQRGQREAREELARRLRRPAYLLALQLLGSADEALDVAQDSMLRFFRHLDRFEAQRPVRPWLFRIVRNRVLDLLRRRRVRRTETLEPGDGARPLEPVSREPDPESRAAESELQRAIWSSLARLPEPQREILVLRDYQDLSYAEIAVLLGIPKGTVMSRLHAARKALRTLVLNRVGGKDG